MLAVVGFILLLINAYFVACGYARDDAKYPYGVPIALMISAGLLLICAGSEPYIPEITLPCIQIIP